MAAVVKFSWNKSRLQFYKSCGHHKTLNGKVGPKRFYLGRDIVIARRKWAAIVKKWLETKHKNHGLWTPEALCDLDREGIVGKNATHLRTAVRKLKFKEKDEIINFQEIKHLPEAQPLLNDDGSIKVGCELALQKLALTQLIISDKNTQTLLDQVQVQWNDDALGTLERISKLGLSPNQLNIGINTAAPNFGINIYQQPEDEPLGLIDATVVEPTVVDTGEDGSKA